MVSNEELRHLLWRAKRTDADALRPLYSRGETVITGRNGCMTTRAVIYDVTPYRAPVEDDYEPTTLVASYADNTGRVLNATVEGNTNTTTPTGSYVACWCTSVVGGRSWSGVTIYTPVHEHNSVAEHDEYVEPNDWPLRDEFRATLRRALYESVLQRFSFVEGYHDQTLEVVQ